MADYVINRDYTATPMYSNRTETLTLGTSDREYTTNTSSQQTYHNFTFHNIELNQRTTQVSVPATGATGVVNLQDNRIRVTGTVTAGSTENLYFRFTGAGTITTLYNITKNEYLRVAGSKVIEVGSQSSSGGLGAFYAYIDIMPIWHVDDGDEIGALLNCDVAYEYWTIFEELKFTVPGGSDDPVCSPTTIPFSFSRYDITGNCTASISGKTLTCRITATYQPTNEDEDTAGGIGNKTIHTFSSEQVRVTYTVPGATTYSYTFSGSDTLTYFPANTPTYTLTGPSGASLVGSVSRNGRTITWTCSGTSSTLPSSSTLSVTYRYIYGHDYNYYFPIYFNGTLKKYKRIYFNDVIYNASNYPR